MTNKATVIVSYRRVPRNESTACGGAQRRPATQEGTVEILETLLELDAGPQLPDGLRVDAFIVPETQ